MATFQQKLLQRLRLNHAYGQLIALIFVPIAVLSGIGAFLVMQETSLAAKSQQHHAASAILSRYQSSSKNLIQLIENDTPEDYEHAQVLMQSMLSEKGLQRAALIDAKGQTQLSIGLQDNKYWPIFPTHADFFGPIEHQHNSFYGSRVGKLNGHALWLVVEMDNEHYKLRVIVCCWCCWLRGY